MFTLPPVSLCRGRLTQPETAPSTSFTRKQLDSAAPLTKNDMWRLAHNKPNTFTKMAVQRRIEEARRLKYGVHDGDD